LVSFELEWRILSLFIHVGRGVKLYGSPCPLLKEVFSVFEGCSSCWFDSSLFEKFMAPSPWQGLYCKIIVKVCDQLVSMLHWSKL